MFRIAALPLGGVRHPALVCAAMFVQPVYSRPVTAILQHAARVWSAFETAQPGEPAVPPAVPARLCLCSPSLLPAAADKIYYNIL